MQLVTDIHAMKYKILLKYVVQIFANIIETKRSLNIWIDAGPTLADT